MVLASARFGELPYFMQNQGRKRTTEPFWDRRRMRTASRTRKRWSRVSLMGGGGRVNDEGDMIRSEDGLGFIDRWCVSIKHELSPESGSRGRSSLGRNLEEVLKRKL
jgi:hypothetical protein